MISNKYLILAVCLFVCCSAAIIPEELPQITNFQDYEITPEEKVLHPDVGLKVVSTIL